MIGAIYEGQYWITSALSTSRGVTDPGCTIFDSVLVKFRSIHISTNGMIFSDIVISTKSTISHPSRTVIDRAISSPFTDTVIRIHFSPTWPSILSDGKTTFSPAISSSGGSTSLIRDGKTFGLSTQTGLTSFVLTTSSGSGGLSISNTLTPSDTLAPGNSSFLFSADGKTLFAPVLDSSAGPTTLVSDGKTTYSAVRTGITEGDL